MSLNAQQMKVVSGELYKNYELLKGDEKVILSQLEFTPKELHDSLEMNRDSNGYDVWKLRDYLVDKLREQGKKPYPFMQYISTKKIT
jgi:hypothetical protein